MKKITLLASLLFVGFTMQAQLFTDDFEDQDISDWTLLDEDGDGFDFRAYNPGGGVDNFMSSDSWDPTVGPLTPNNYTISPEIDATNATALSLVYEVGGQDPDFSEEVYTVYVSTGNTIADFMNADPAVTVSFTEDLGDDPAAAGMLVPRSLDLSTLEGATSLYIAFRHHDVSDQFIINFDNVILNGVILSVSDNAFNSFKYFVDSRNQLNLRANTPMENVKLYNVLGQQVVSQKLANSSETINISSLNSGVYIAMVTIDGQNKSFKIVKK